jgi:hypothetical protein
LKKRKKPGVGKAMTVYSFKIKLLLLTHLHNIPAITKMDKNRNTIESSQKKKKKKGKIKKP